MGNAPRVAPQAMPRVTRRRIVAWGGAVATALPLGATAGCTGTGGGQPSANIAAKPAKIVLRTLTTPYPVSVLDQTILPAYKQKAPQHTVDWERGAEGVGMIEAVMAGSAAGTAPDLFWIGSDFVAQLARGKVIREIGGYVKTWNQDKDYYASTIEPLWGRRWFLPGIASCDIYLYRKDWFRDANLPVDQAAFPTTWEAFADAAGRLTRRQGDEFTRAGFQLTGGSNDRREWRQLLWQAGGEEWNADHSKALFNSQAGVEALQYIVDLYGKYRVSPPGGVKNPSGTGNVFSAGVAAMLRATPSTASAVRTATPDVFAQTGFGPPHKRAKQVSQIDVDGWAMPVAAREPDAGFALLAFIQEPENLLAWNEAGGLIPPRKSLASSAHGQQPYIKSFLEMLDKYGRGYQQYNQPASVAAMVDAVEGKKGVKQALDDAARETDAFIATLQPAPK
jgi:multiple sugar transport system substrate-binding protein